MRPCLCRSVYMLGPGVYVLNSGCLRVFGGCDIQIPAGLSFSVIENPKSGGVVFFLSFEIQILAGLYFSVIENPKSGGVVFFLSFFCLLFVFLLSFWANVRTPPPKSGGRPRSISTIRRPMSKFTTTQPKSGSQSPTHTHDIQNPAVDRPTSHNESHNVLSGP